MHENITGGHCPQIFCPSSQECAPPPHERWCPGGPPTLSQIHHCQVGSATRKPGDGVTNDNATHFGVLFQEMHKVVLKAKDDALIIGIEEPKKHTKNDFF